MTSTEQGAQLSAEIVPINLFVRDVPEETRVRRFSWILSRITTYPTLQVLAFLAPGNRKDASLGRLFSQVKPLPAGFYWLEIALALPDLFPFPEDAQEWVFDAPDQHGRNTHLVFSNQMALAHYGSQGHPVHSLLPRSGMRTVPKSVGIPDGAPVEPIRTMVSCRFKIRGKDTEAAVSDSFDECLGRIIYILNNCTAVLNSLLGPNQDHLSPVYSRSTFGTAYILVRGLEGRGTCHRIMLNGARVVLNTSTLSKRQIRRLNDHIAGDRSIHEAEQFVQSGYYYMQNELLEIALLHIMIGIELATTRLVTGRLSKQGVSKSKMKGAKRDLTFSMMLNILLPSLNPKRTPLPEQWISQINWGRQRRNDFMHEGKVRLSKEEIRQLFDAGVQFLDFFREYI